MHPRNPLKELQFIELAKEFKPMKQYIKNGTIRADFKDPRFMRNLAMATLWKYFGLRLEIPLTNLIPAVPNRVDYILIIQDLLNESSSRPRIGMDIGTGASCIYPLLGCSICPHWKFIGVEIDNESIKFCRDNVARNGLDERITIVKANDKELIPSQYAGNIDFVICNPPFYYSKQQILDGKAAKSVDSSGECTGTLQEMITKGGEVEFIKTMIKESLKLRHVSWFTAQVGIKKDVEKLTEFILDLLGNLCCTFVKEIQQGLTKRWILCWTFKVSDSNKTPSKRIKLHNKDP